LPELLTPFYIRVLGQLTKRNEVNPNPHNPAQVANSESEWPSSGEISEMLASFQDFPRDSEGGSVVYLVKLAKDLTSLFVRFPRLCENVSNIAYLVANIVQDDARALRNPNTDWHQRDHNRCSLNYRQAYDFFLVASEALDSIIEKHVNHLSMECATRHIWALTEIYQTCLAVDGIVPPQKIADHRQTHLPIANHHLPEALSYHWRFTILRRLILSSQMQLRVMAVSAMCTDLVSIWARYKGSDEGHAFLRYMADFLLSTGLVAYILGPTCHPEITIESSNIIGFLLVSNTYTDEHTDLMWQTVTSTQDPRVSEGLVRMCTHIVNIYPYHPLMYLCEKLSTVSVDAFSPYMRDLCKAVLTQIMLKFSEARKAHLEATPYMLCIRLIRESSVFGSQSPIAHPEVLAFATSRLNELLSAGHPSPSSRHDIYLNCLSDIQDKSQTSLGSMCVLSTMLRSTKELPTLAADHDLARILTDELEAAIPAARAAGFPAVISGPHNIYRKDLIRSVVCELSHSITQDLGPRLWNLLVGPGAACQEDRDTAWSILNHCYKVQGARNPFIQACSSEHLPTLPSQCLCNGALDFIEGLITPLLSDGTSTVLEDEDGVGKAEIEHLWRIVLTAPPHTIEERAIHFLVNNVYMESECIKGYAAHRALRVHLTVARRCLRQLSLAAAKLRAFSDGTGSGDDAESMVLVASDQQVREQEILFIRSLAVLRELHRINRATPRFSTPDMASLILDPSQEVQVQGEPAELKYQAFSGEEETDIMPLGLGKLNTVGSLLSILQEATGFSNFRIYFRGDAFYPQENDLGRSLENVGIVNCLVLVKREPDVLPSAKKRRIRPGASAVENEILGHFEELWSFLDMDAKLSEEIFNFLVKLPAEENMMRALASPEVPYTDIFPIGQSFKALYGVNVLRNAVNSALKQISDVQPPGQRDSLLENSHVTLLCRAMSLLVSAISDKDVVGECPTPALQIQLSSEIIDVFLSIVRNAAVPDSVFDLVDGRLLESLLATMPPPVTPEGPPPSDNVTKQMLLCLHAIFNCCSRSRQFWNAFRKHDGIPDLLAKLLLRDVRKPVRENLSRLIRERAAPNDGSMDTEFSAFFWPLISQLLETSALQSPSSSDLVDACLDMLPVLWKSGSPILDHAGFLTHMGVVLLSYTSWEDITRPEKRDPVAQNLLKMVHFMVFSEEYADAGEEHALCQPGFARRLFWKHLYPPWEAYQTARVPRLILNTDSRTLAIEIMFKLVEHDHVQLQHMVEDLEGLVPYFPDEHDGLSPLPKKVMIHCLTWNAGENYAYELPQQFERFKAIRAPCGYVGLKNLSNTCYFNSLFTQLFMNVEFRRFMFSAIIRHDGYSQQLLLQTQKLFAGMQQSIRRFMDPSDCVAAIKNYEDGQIDIHNQMDVDEFYNLLFDRWEGQLNGAEAKRRFRSFYGGQLVQQVASKECDHISERLEPFSAIQCDIKGKASLEESLQAYVDGEIMEGDNKYKCSTCDRHVDAVKRACLKDIPDHLIFHLKRFDFNLRTLQRSKINDHFAFPSKLDMRPYTIDALTNPSPPMDEAEAEDIFELVGVLVHSGTAESGHYYSYVRERPTASEGQRWVEFNDDVVSEWDPSQMRDACFGGADYRAAENGAIYDKTYSAYMLFYQRSSSLRKEQELGRQFGVRRPLMHRELKEEVVKDNITLLRRHCLYDKSHADLVTKALACVGDQHQEHSSHPPHTGDKALEMALSHLDQVASRAKDTPDFGPLAGQVESLAQGCIQCSYNTYTYFDTRHGALRALVQRNPEPMVRQRVADMIIKAVREIKHVIPEEYCPPNSWWFPFPEHRAVLHGMMRMFKVLFDSFQYSIRAWSEVFGFMLSFVKMGPVELAAFLQHPFLKNLLLIIQADSAMEGLTPQFSRMAHQVSRRMATRPPAYDTIIALIDTLLQKLALPVTGHPGVKLIDDPEERLGDGELVGLDDLAQRFYPMTRQELHILHMEWDRNQPVIFLEKLIALNQNLDATESIIRTYMGLAPAFEDKVFRALEIDISGELNSGQLPSFPVAPFLHIAGRVYCRYAHHVAHIHHLIAHVSKQCMPLQSVEGAAFFEFHEAVFDGPRENSGESPTEVLLYGLRNLPEWVPGLLSYYEALVGQMVVVFLDDKIFSHGTSPELEVGMDPVIAKEMVKAARILGIRCLVYLRDKYVSQGDSLASSQVTAFEQVIAKCSLYYNVEEKETDKMTTEFFSMHTGK
jgi:ubiquitin carboxyl-terminal hydrolase 34